MRRLPLMLLAGLIVFGPAVVQAQEDAGSAPTNSRNRGVGTRGATNNSSNRAGRQGNSPNENEQRSSQQRQQKTRNNNNNLRGTANKGGAQAAQGKAPTAIKAKAPAKPAGSGAAAGGSSAPPVEFKMTANPNVNIVYIEGLTGSPTLNMQAVEGAEFSTRVALRNGRHSRFRTLEFSIRYNPSVLEPVGIDDSDLDDLLDEEASASVDQRKGIVRFHARLAESRDDGEFTIAKIRWRAVGVSSNSPLVFLNTPEFPTRILSADGANVLQMRDENDEVGAFERAGLLDASVAVAPGAGTATALDENENALSSLVLANRISEGTADGGIALALRPRSNAVGIGQDFLVDIVYANPRRAELDTLRLTIKFDPRVLEVVDADAGNWITHGVNIFDGDYHEELPFDYHIRNSAYNSAGEIRYEKGFSNRVTIPAAGTVATIRFRAKAPSPASQVTFDLDETSPGTPATTASFLGFNLIGAPGQRAAAVTGAAIAVQ